jgi:hypothetical protein
MTLIKTGRQFLKMVSLSQKSLAVPVKEPRNVVRKQVSVNTEVSVLLIVHVAFACFQ